MINGITVVIPSIPPRAKLLQRAIHNVNDAIVELGVAYGVPGSLVTIKDLSHQGAAKTRHRGLLAVDTEWVAFLDDDDVMHPDHLVQLYGAALEHNADYLWSRFQIIRESHVWSNCSDIAGCPIPTAQHRGTTIVPEHGFVSAGPVQHLRPRTETFQGPQFLGEKAFSQWNDEDPCQTTITTLVRTKLALAAGGFEQFEDDGSLVDGNRRGEDHEFTLRCRAAGGVFRHVPRVTWDWYHHSGNTSGLPTW